jgi:hypothetical protein
MEVTGKIIKIGDTETVGSAGTFKKRQLVVATDEQYSQEIPIDFVQDKCSILDSYKQGEEVKVSINIRGNSYNGKWYCSLQGWRIERLQGAPAIPPAAEPNIPPYNGNENEGDGMPF